MDFSLETLQALVVEYGLSVLGGVLTVLIGYWLAGVISRFFKRTLSRTDTDKALIRFGSNIIYYAIIAFAVVSALGQIGVQTASFVAVIGAAGLAIGLALQGALANFAAGVIILLFRPFRLGDVVEISDEFGTVESIQIFHTVLITPDNKTVIIPNEEITSGNIVNYTKRGMLRVDMTFGIGYGDDLLKAKQILEKLLTEDERVLDEPAATVAVSELGDSSVNFTVRPYVKISKMGDYWAVYFDMHEKVKLRFDEEGISIPFPQRDVHLFQNN